MKNYTILLLSALLGLFSSCNNWLEVTPANSVDSRDLFETGYGFRNALNGIYLNLGNRDVYGENLSWGFLSAVAQQYVTNPEQLGSRVETVSQDAATLEYNTVTTRPIVTKIWESQYLLIANINKLLENIDAADYHKFAYGEQEKSLIRAEALALRAFVHFDLLRLFAPAPATDPSGTYIPYRESYSSAVADKLAVGPFLEKVLRDIAAAEPALKYFDTEYHPKAMYASQMTEASSHWSAVYRFASKSYLDEMGQFFWFRGVRMNYMALLALKARVCLYAGPAYYKNAEVAARELYDTFYLEKKWIGFTPAENITCVQANRYAKVTDDVLFGAYYRNLATEFESNLFGNSNVLLYPLANISSLFASDNTGVYSDYRLSYLTGKTNEVNSKYYTLKYSPSSESTVSIMENPLIPVIRFSEVCYILAELSAYNNRISEGVAFLEQVRNARGAARPLSLTVTTREALMDEILLDARKEFIAEGNLFYRYKRLNLSSVPSSMNTGQTRDMSNGYVLPVPTSENPF